MTGTRCRGKLVVEAVLTHLSKARGGVAMIIELGLCGMKLTLSAGKPIGVLADRLAIVSISVIAIAVAGTLLVMTMRSRNARRIAEQARPLPRKSHVRQFGAEDDAIDVVDMAPDPEAFAEFVIRCRGREWWPNVDRVAVLRPRSVDSEPCAGWGDHRIALGDVTIEFSYEDPGWQVVFLGTGMTPDQARLITEEILENLREATGLDGYVHEVSSPGPHRF